MTGEAAAGESLVAAMSRPAFYPHEPDRVELVETHVSWVFLADDLVYKVRKPVVFPFLDYGTLERRRRMCEEEVRLGRRLAPDLYLGVRPIIRTAHGYALNGAGAPCEYAVEQRRVDEHEQLGRNDPCWCGSGKKFKKCHGA